MDVENAAVIVEESSVLDVKSGTALIISSGRVHVHFYADRLVYKVTFWGTFRISMYL